MPPAGASAHGEARPAMQRIDVGGHALRVTLESLHDDPLTPKLAAIRCPVLLIVGEKDPMGPRASEIIAVRLPAARLEVVPDCGHWVHVEKPQAVLEAFDRWLPRVRSWTP